MTTLHGEPLVLLIDGDDARARFIAASLARVGWKAQRLADPSRAAPCLAAASGVVTDAVLIASDFVTDGLTETVAASRAILPRPPVVVHATEPPTLAHVVEALRNGADDILVAPLSGERIDRAMRAARAAVQRGTMSSAPLSFDALPAPQLDEIPATSAPMKEAVRLAGQAARGCAPVVLVGEPGSGRCILAHALHRHAGEGTPLVTFDCADHPPSMIAPLLFGYEQGAFPGAFERNSGRIAGAEGGSLIIRNAELLPADAQARLAEYLHGGWVLPVGGTVAHRHNVRLIASSTTSLRRLAERGDMREDLAARWSVVEIAVPPLRERKGDIWSIASSTIAQVTKDGSDSHLLSDPGVRRTLEENPWPTNVLGLRSTILRAYATSACNGSFTLGETTITAPTPDMASTAASDVIGGTLELLQADGHLRSLDAIEADVIRLAIRHYQGRMSEVARRLGIGRSTLYRKLSEIGIDTAA